MEVQSAASNNPIFAHYLFESICTASRIAASLGQQATVESTLMPTLAPIVANGEHDFNPYALQVGYWDVIGHSRRFLTFFLVQVLGLLLDTASVASPVYIDLLNHLLVEQQWTTSTVGFSFTAFPVLFIVIPSGTGSCDNSCIGSIFS